MKIPFKRYPYKLDLGEHYILQYFDRVYVVRFIQPTPKGFNFLVVSTAKCLLKHHLYVQRDTKNTFWIGDHVKSITKHELIAKGSPILPGTETFQR